MLMGAWNEIKLGDLFNIKAGGDLQESSFSKTYSELTPYPVFSNSLINKGLFGFTSAPRYSRNCITITGRGDLGHAEYRDIEFDAIVRLLVLSPKTDVDCVFVTYYINGILKFSIESTGVPQLPAPRVTKKKILIPESIQEQTAIASILTKVDEAILATQNSIKAAEKLKKALMQNLLTGKLKTDGTWRTEDEFYMDEKFGKVPNGWRVMRVKELTNCLDSKRKPIKSEDRSQISGIYRYYGAAGIIDYINDFIFNGRYLLFGEDGENLISRKRPQAFIVEGKFWVNNHAHILESIDGISDLDYLCYQLESKNYENIVYGSAQPKINKSDLAKIKVLTPVDVNEQNYISHKLNTFDEIIKNKQNKVETLQRLKKSLMQNLLTGKVRVDVEKILELCREK